MSTFLMWCLSIKTTQIKPYLQQSIVCALVTRPNWHTVVTKCNKLKSCFSNRKKNFFNFMALHLGSAKQKKS